VTCSYFWKDSIIVLLIIIEQISYDWETYSTDLHHVHSMTCCNFEMDSHCFHASHPIDMREKHLCMLVVCMQMNRMRHLAIVNICKFHFHTCFNYGLPKCQHLESALET
jgi:hypothetical protein